MIGLDTNIKYRSFSTMKSAGRVRVVSHFTIPIMEFAYYHVNT